LKKISDNSRSSTKTSSHPSEKIQAANIQWDQEGQPKSKDFDDVYFNTDSGIDESRYVFINPSQLQQRWSRLFSTDETNCSTFTILETGFGTGLNFLSTWLEWRLFLNKRKTECNKECNKKTHLHYISIEKFPLSTNQLAKALSLFPQLKEFSDPLIAEYPLLIKGFHSLQFKHQNLTLTLIFDDVNTALPQLNGPIDAWYLDGFAPAKNPDMWGDNLYRSMAALSRENTSLATFTSAGDVRRGLTASGFKLNKVSGFGMKREMMYGTFIQSQGPLRNKFESLKPWLSPAKTLIKDIAIIGAGIAGCTTAYALARRGFKVTVFDPNGIANEASGNPQGAMYAKLAAGEATHSNIYVQGYLQSLRWLKQQLAPGDGWDNCGLIQLASSEKESARQKKFIENTDYPTELLHGISQEKASDISGLTMNCGGLFFPEAGWVSPQRLCQELLKHPLITYQQENINRLIQLNESDSDTSIWKLQSEDLNESLNFSHVVIACANKSQQLLPDSYLPTKSIRGQLTYLPEENGNPSSKLKTVLCGKGYIAPASNGKLCLGASYNIKDDEPNMRLVDHQKNLDYLDDFGEEFKALHQELNQKDAQSYPGRTGFRCTTPDYLPMAGPLLDEPKFDQEFTAIRKNLARYPRQQAPTLSGLYLNIGHGSRGLTSAPLCAELVASYICGENFPLAKDHAEALLPGRFYIREMVRNKR
jgi:tRNA 5-methylaminomethyl-2-thiouridine biosynthesis bifunctional protein